MSAGRGKGFGPLPVARLRARMEQRLRHEPLSGRKHARPEPVHLHRIGDPTVDQLQAVVGTRLILALGEAVFEQRGVEQVAGIIAGEGTAGAVGALHPRRKADDQQARLDVAERRNRRIVPQWLARAVRLAKGDQARAERTVTVGDEGGGLAA